MEGGRIELDFVTIDYKEPIVFMVFKKSAELGIPEIRQLTTYAEMVSGKKTYVVLSDVCENVNVTHEGRRLAVKAEAAPLNRGTAVLVKNQLVQAATTLFSMFDKPEFPYRVFTSKHEAIEWLLALPLEKV